MAEDNRIKGTDFRDLLRCTPKGFRERWNRVFLI